MKKLERVEVNKNRHPDVPKDYAEEKEIWGNDVYTVFVNRDQPTGMSNDDDTPVLITWLSIKRNDRQAKPDWRDFQWIKNQLVGEENEGCEIYPAESRLVDGANQFHLWVFQDNTFRLPFGFTDERIVSQTSMFGETQRKFPANRMPKDLAESEAKVRQWIEANKKKEIDGSSHSLT